MKTYSLNDRHPDILRLQRCMNEVLGLSMKPDGIFGRMTQSALVDYQKLNNISETNRSGACYGPITQAVALPFINRKYIKESDFQEAASKLGVELNVVKAVTNVEALQFGFFNNGTPVMLFERHIFYRELVKSKGEAFAKQTAAKHPTLCNPATGAYIGGVAEVGRLSTAMQIDEGAALKSASYGLFQIMGFNHAQAGYANVISYYSAMCASEKNQLDAFVSFVLLNRSGILLNSLKSKDFTNFARIYNGPGYKKNNYDVKMLNEYNRLSAIK